MIVPCPVVLPHGWQLQQDPDGSWWRVRRKRGRESLWAPGLVLWLTSYSVGIFGGLADMHLESSLPIAGAFVAAATTATTGEHVAWAVDGVAQLAGLVMFIVGASLEGKLEKLPVTVGPTTFHGGGSGVAVTGRF
jgi:hypothetical protein